jgi:predicted CXXCH cytochrome family protein
MDTTGTAVVGATVYAIPATDVVALAATSLDSTVTATSGNYSAAAQSADEPLEDLISANSGTYMSAVTDSTGKAVFADNLATSDKFFIAVKPSTADHLPGGSKCRDAVTGSSLNNATTAIEVSTTPSSSATFVGTSACLSCHSEYATVKQTMHKLGFMAPNAPSGLQDRSEFDVDNGIYNMSAGLEKYSAGDATSGGTTVYFYDYDSTRKFDKFKTLESAPTGTVYATVRLYKDTADNKYKSQFTNVINPSDPNSGMIHEAVLTYGGGVYKQRNITKVDDSLFMIPLQFNPQGSDASTDRTRKIWRDYHMDWWVSSVTPTTMTFKAKPAANTSVDVQCAPCHFNGYKLTSSATYTGYYTAEGVADANGEIHPVTGVAQELNIGCETCHGPGSEHVAASGNGAKIVTPQNITPERANMICGQCHSRPQGNGTFKNDSPLSSSNKMMIAGTSRADFLANQTSRHDASATAGDFWGDKLHSKSHHQQYTDFIKTSKYRNGTSLKTCASCHDPHGPGTGVRHQLKATTSDNKLCTSCHTVEVVAHMTAKTGTSMGASTQCIQCHMPETSSSGAGSNSTTPVTGGTSAVKYFQGDISSHLFDVPLKTSISSTNTMPVPYTNNCGVCHDYSTM